MGPIGQTSAARAFRQRLSARLAETRVGVIWAAGGYGKSTLAMELREVLGCDAITVGFAAVAAPLLALIEALDERHRVLLLARAPVAGFEGLESSPGTAVLTARDLAFTTDEILALSRPADPSALEASRRRAAPRHRWLGCCGRARGGPGCRERRPGSCRVEQDGHGAVLSHLLSGSAGSELAEGDKPLPPAWALPSPALRYVAASCWADLAAVSRRRPRR